MKGLKRWLAGILCACLMMQGSGVTLYAAEPPQDETAPIEADAPSVVHDGEVSAVNTWVNPLYRDILPEDFEEELRADAEASAQQSRQWTGYAARYYDIDGATEFLRENMVKRNTTVDVPVQVSMPSGADGQTVLNETIQMITQNLFVETDASDEGDYLRYHVRGYGSTASASSVDGQMMITLKYTVQYLSDSGQEEQVTERLNQLYAGDLNMDGKSDDTKIAEIYGYIADNITYDYDGLKQGANNSPKTWSAYGGLIDGTCVCQGYASLLYRMMKDNGISVRIISGIGNGGAHAWNIVEYNGLYYNMDATWDGYTTDSYGNKWDGKREWFMRSPHDFSDHERDAEYASDDFLSKYPMAEVSYGKGETEQSPVIKEDNIDEYTFDELDGGTVTNQAENGNHKLLIFGSVSCNNTKNLIQQLESKGITENQKLDIAFIDINQNTKEDVERLREEAGGNIQYCYCTDNVANGAMWRYLAKIGVSGRVSLPVPVLIDASNHVRLISYGSSSVGEVFDVLATVLGPQPPQQPEAAMDMGAVILSWPAVDGAASYNVYRSARSDAAMTLIASGVTATSYRDATVADEGDYYYAVTAVSDNLESNKSEKCHVTIVVTEDTYSITYELNGGENSADNPGSYTAAMAAITLKNPTRTGYTFGGWYSDSDYKTKVTQIAGGSAGNLTLYARWTANQYTIVFKGNGSASGSMSSMTKCKYATEYTLTANAFQRKGYTFTGWNTKAGGSGTGYANKARVSKLSAKSGGKVTLYAQWEPTKYTITYNLNGGTNKNPASYDITTATITLKDPTRTGYTFKGWYSDAKYKTKVTKIAKGSTGNRTLYAKWTANKYTIVFNGNGATSGKMSSMTNRSYATKYTLTANAFQRKGYTFTGWNTKANGSGTGYANKAKVLKLSSKDGGKVTLYAQWKKTYTITYKLNGGKNNAANPKNYTITTSTIKLKNPTRTGYTFKGWYADSKYKTKVTQIAKGSTGNKTLYAKWAKK